MPRVIMLGPPGAGKGTQGTRLAALWEVPHVSSGDLLRRALEEDSDSAVARAARAILDGHMVSDEVASEIVFAELERPSAARGFILDGYPRNTHQAEILREYLQKHHESLTAVIALQISEPVLTARLMGRLTCPHCGESYHVTASPPKVPGICDRCGSELKVRDDDQPEAIRLRLALYAERTAPLRAFYEEAELLRLVDAEGDEDTVFGRCLSAVAGVQAGRQSGMEKNCLV